MISLEEETDNVRTLFLITSFSKYITSLTRHWQSSEYKPASPEAGDQEIYTVSSDRHFVALKTMDQIKVHTSSK